MSKIRRLNAILFADIAGYTSIMQQDESRAQSYIQKFRSEIESQVPKYNGRIINFMGDGCLCVFESSVNALECAHDLQQSFINHNIPVRIGLHSGDVYFENETVFGDSVNIASRIESIGIPGSILFSERINSDIRNRPALQTGFIGEVTFKNVTNPIKIFALVNEGFSVPVSKNLEGKIDRTIKKKSKNWIIYAVVALVALVLFTYALQSELISIPDGTANNTQLLTVAVLGFENKSGLEEYDIISEISSDRIINGISQYNIARVISRKTIEDYEKISFASAASINQATSLKNKFAVNRIIEGQIYAFGDQFLMDCNITDPDSDEILLTMPTVRFDEVDPMKGIEEMREHILSALIVDQDRSQNLLLETRPPNFEAYKALLAAKEIEDDEDMLVLLNKAIELDAGYFEPKLLRISCYYNLGLFRTADSLTKVLEREFLEADPRQKNLLNFYKALMSGQNNLIYHHFNEELKLAPFDLMSNTSTMVLATDFINDIQQAFDIYDVIDEKMLDYSNCERCRTRLYVKMYMDLEAGDNDNALRLGKIVSDNGGKEMIEKLRIRAWVRSGKWNELNQYIEDEQRLNGTDIGSLSLYAAKECALAENQKQFEVYQEAALQSISAMATSYRKAEIALISGEYEESNKYFQETIDKDDTDVQNWCMLAASHILNGNTAHGESLLEKADQMRKPYQYGDVDYFLSQAFSIIGEEAKALEHLRLAFIQGQRIGYHGFQNDYWLIPIREDPKFAEILAYWRN